VVHFDSMAVAQIEVPPDPSTAVSLPMRPSAAIVSRSTATNLALAEAFSQFGYRGFVADPAALLNVHDGDLVLGRFDVLPTLDGVEDGLWRLPALERQGAHVLNGPVPLLTAHDKLLTALLLGRAGIAQPRTAHVRAVSVPAFPPPYVVKPRFGSWGGDVYRCETEDELVARLGDLAKRRWFGRQGALVQELVECDGTDLRVVVAGGRVVGAIERVAAPDEWRTNVALGARRHRTAPSPFACVLALRAVAALGLDLAGVDLLTDRTGRQVVLEVNGAVDFTSDYGDDVFAAAAEALIDAVYAGDGDERLDGRSAHAGVPAPLRAC
jgi:RimK family alpha-L-glutamate ligase